MKAYAIISLIGAFIFSLGAWSQKANETSAAVEYTQKFRPALMSMKLDDAKVILLNAKKYIDLAASHPDTKESAKMFYYKGEIYGAAYTVSAMTNDSVYLYSNFGHEDSVLQTAIYSFQESWKKHKKYRPEIENSVNMQVSILSPAITKLYEEEKFEEAGEGFYYIYMLSQAKNVIDTANLYNAGLCYEKAEKYEKAAKVYTELSQLDYNKGESYSLAARAYANIKDYNKAEEILIKGKEKYGNDKLILFELVNLYLQQGDNNRAEKALNDAIASDPDNKQLHFTIGTIYTDLGENEKAEQALLKALSIDPNYSEAQYNLGAHYVSWATDLRNKASFMDENDFNYDITLEKSNQLYQKALEPLEKYIDKNPNEASVLLILFQINQNIGNTEKATEYKKRYDEANK